MDSGLRAFLLAFCVAGAALGFTSYSHITCDTRLADHLLALNTHTHTYKFLSKNSLCYVQLIHLQLTHIQLAHTQLTHTQRTHTQLTHTHTPVSHTDIAQVYATYRQHNGFSFLDSMPAFDIYCIISYATFLFFDCCICISSVDAS